MPECARTWCVMWVFESLVVYINKYYRQVYLDKCIYKIVNKQMTDYLDENIFIKLDIINALLR